MLPNLDVGGDMLGILFNISSTVGHTLYFIHCEPHFIYMTAFNNS